MFGCMYKPVLEFGQLPLSLHPGRHTVSEQLSAYPFLTGPLSVVKENIKQMQVFLTQFLISDTG